MEPPSFRNWDEFMRWLAENVKRHYSVDEFAVLVKRSPFTVREWCRLGRINAERSRTQTGPARLWVISHAELERYRRERLLPPSGRRNGDETSPDDSAPAVPARLSKPKPKPLVGHAALICASDDEEALRCAPDVQVPQ